MCFLRVDAISGLRSVIAPARVIATHRRAVRCASSRLLHAAVQGAAPRGSPRTFPHASIAFAALHANVARTHYTESRSRAIIMDISCSESETADECIARLRRAHSMISKLDLSTPDVVELVSDFDALVVLEALRRAHAIASARQLEGSTGLAASAIDAQLARLASLGLVRRTRAVRGRVATGYSADQEPLVLTFDPADPQSALRAATVRLALLSHAARIAAARSVARSTVGVVPMDAKHYASLMRSHDRVDEALAEAGRGGGSPSGNGNGRTPRYRVQMSVETVAPGPLALPTVMLMQRAESGRMSERQARPALRDLSTREREVAEALGGGSTKREIAEKLGIKFSTVNTLVTRIYRKLGVTRRAQLVNVIRNGG